MGNGLCHFPLHHGCWDDRHTVTHAAVNTTSNDVVANAGQESAGVNSSSAVTLASHAVSQSGSPAETSATNLTTPATSAASNTTSNSNATSAAATSVAQSSAQPANHLAVSLATTSASDAPTVKAEDRSVYVDTTFTAKELVNNVADFPEGTTFSYVNNSEPKWNQVGTYNAQIVASYTQNGRTVTTGPVTVKVTVSSQMEYNVKYVDDDEANNEEITRLDYVAKANESSFTCSPLVARIYEDQPLRTSYEKRYQSVSVEGVPEGVYITGSQWVPFSQESCDWLYPNNIWLKTDADTIRLFNLHAGTHYTTVTDDQVNAIMKALYGSTITIHLKHKTQDVTATDPKAKETRDITVNYTKVKVADDGTYTADGEAFQPAQVRVFFKRTATQDLVTGTVTYGPWQWDTNGGNHGYNPYSGTWTNLPQSWDSVVAAVPTLDGYVAYTGGPASNTNHVPANEFVFPTWNGSAGSTSENEKGSLAYTADASIYEAQPTHTIYYIPVKSETRTVTAKFVKVNSDGSTSQFAPDAKVQVFYDQDATINTATNKVVYSWQWDTSKGDTATPGYHVVSGSWTLPTNGQTGSFTVNAPDGGTSYSKVNSGVGGYNTYTFGSPNTQPTTQFTNDTDSTWFYRNELTTYYVPNSEGNKSVARVINVYYPNSTVTHSFTQNATISRQVRVNSDESGVTYDGFEGSGWKASNDWAAYTVPSYAGYTPVITQIVTHPDGTTTETKLDSIKDQTVDINTLPTVINVTYTATSRVAFTGSNQSTYTGKQISGVGEGTLNVHVTGPSSGDWSLRPGDVEFSSDNGQTWTTTLPTNAGTYQLRLSDQAIQDIKKQYGNNNIKWTDDNGNSTITSTATYTINPAQTNAVLSNKTVGNYSKVYDGQPTSTIDASKFTISTNLNGISVSLKMSGIGNDSYEWVDANGNPISNPENAGTYYVKLKDSAFATLQRNNPNFTLTNTGLGTYTITKATASAVFSGDPSHTYTGTANGNYLNEFSVKLNEPTNSTYKFVPGDLEFNVNGTWTTEVPVNVGSYQVRVSQAGWDNIKKINSDNVTWAATAGSGSGTYTITAATANTKLSGENSMVYNGRPVTTEDLYTTGSTIKVAISGDNIVDLPTSFTLEDGDYTWNTAGGSAPVNAGDYTISLTDAGLNKIQAAIDQAVGAGNVVLSKENTGSATFHIVQAVSANVALTGEIEKTYNGQAVTFDPNDAETKTHYNFNNVEGLTIPNLTASDFDWYDANNNKLDATPTNAGTYHLVLNAAGKKAFADANPNYTFVNKDGQSTLGGQINYVINPASLDIRITGQASKVYDGQHAAISQAQLNRGDIKLEWGNSTDKPAGLGEFTLTPDDLEVVDANGNSVSNANADKNSATGNPVYYVRLTDAGLARIKALAGASNYKITLSDSAGTYLIYAHKAQVTLSGNQTTTYGTVLPLDPSAYHIALTNWTDNAPVPTDAEIIRAINGLQAGDVQIVGYENGLPTDAGTYQVKITQQLLNRLKSAFPDYDWDAVNGLARSSSSIVEAEHDPATYVIKPAVTTVTINGDQHVKYGQSTAIQYAGNNGYSITITAPVKNATTDNPKKPIYQNVKLAAGDLVFVTTPGNVGSYEVKLSEQGLNKLQTLAGASNYDWAQAAQARANFFVDQMPVTITVGGNEQNVTYGSADWLKAIKKNPQDYSITVTTEDGTPLTYAAQNGDLIFSQTPGNVGSYNVVLSDKGLTNIERALGTNYTYPQNAGDVTTHGTFNIKQGTVTITLNGHDNKTYDGQTASLSTGKYHVDYSATVYDPAGNAQTITLDSSDLQFVDGDPINAGSYQVELSPAGQEKLKNLTGNNGDNYQWTFDSKADYTIAPASQARAVLSGANQKAFDGTAVTTADINNGGSIVVKLTFPGSNDNSTYTLQDGDYTWTNGSAPTKVGSYTIQLTPAGLAHLQNTINNIVGSGNVTLSADQLSGSANFGITPKPISNVTISASDQNKTYDGQAASLDLSQLKINGDGTVANTPLSDSGITASDFDWYDAQGNKLESAPVNAGDYEARLNSAALTKLQNANPNYSFDSVTGTINFTIKQARAVATVSGTQDSQDPALDPAKYSVVITVNGQPQTINGLTAADFAFSKDGHPAQLTAAGTYDVRLSDAAMTRIRQENPNYDIDFNSDASFTLENSSQTIQYVDADGRVISSTTIDGHLKGDRVNFTPEIPAGWEASDPNALPSEITINNGVTRIELKRIKQEVGPSQPSQPAKPGQTGQGNGKQPGQLNGGQVNGSQGDHGQTTNAASHQQRLPQTGNTANEKSGAAAAILLSI